VKETEAMTSSASTDLQRVREKYRLERDKRLDPRRRDILDLSGHEELLEDPFTSVAERDPVYDVVDAVVVGAGWGGLLAAAHLHKQGVRRIRIIDKAGDVGGVWYWNRYPGVMCDVESYIYLPLLEELQYIPRHRYSYGPEIREYAGKVAKHFGLYDLALFHTAATGMRWQEESGSWQVTTDRGDSFRAQYVVLAHGSFTSLKLPDIPGIDAFRGKLFHTSRWDYDYTGGDTLEPLDKLHDKTVGVVGTGASAVQVVAPVGEAAKQCYVFQRTPSTVAPRNNAETDPKWAASLQPGWQKARRDNFTAVTNGEQVGEDLVGDGWTVFYQAMLSDAGFAGLPPEQVAEHRERIDLAHMESIRARIDSTVSDAEVAERLKPYYRYQCKRPAFHDEYLPAFNLPNVHLVDTDGKGVERITERGVHVNGTEYELDLIVLATGFDQDSPYTDRIGFDVVGVGKQRLSEKWADGPETLHGIMTSGFPNFFLLPPNYHQGTAAVNFVHTLEETARHIATVVGELQRRGVVADVSRDAELAYVAQLTDSSGLALLGSRKFLEDCTPGRWNNEGDLSARPSKWVNYPGVSSSYFAMLDRWRSDGKLAGLKLSAHPVRER
jgi:cation diffusion facilitator CzcD-associated flavoprotein CzcO